MLFEQPAVVSYDTYGPCPRSALIRGFDVATSLSVACPLTCAYDVRLLDKGRRVPLLIIVYLGGPQQLISKIRVRFAESRCPVGVFAWLLFSRVYAVEKLWFEGL